MAKITIVGAGASAVHFALSALARGHRVEMLDVGYSGPEPLFPGESFCRLKEKLDDPARYFLGDDLEGFTAPGSDQEYYGIPPVKSHIFRVPGGFTWQADGFEPLFSFAQGGLAEAWTGGSYPFIAAELEDFPFGYDRLEPFYAEVTARIGIIGAPDDLTPFFPLHANLLPPIPFDEHSALLIDTYAKKRELLHKKFGCRMGRSRVAVLSGDRDGRKACDQSGRCMWGCPSQSLYTPLISLRLCLKHPDFSYRPGLLVDHFVADSGNRIRRICAHDVQTGAAVELTVENLVLAAGTLASSAIYAASVLEQTGRTPVLSGLMDNRQILMPFINLGMIGKAYLPESYQYHQLAMGLVAEKTKEYIHLQLTTLKTALMHPVIQAMPLDLRTAIFLGRNLHAALGVANLNFCDTRRPGNTLTVERDPDSGQTRLRITYRPPAGENELIRATMKKVSAILLRLGAIVPPGMSHIRPMGASVHYAGTIPMTPDESPHTTTPGCRNRLYPNLHIVDGSTFPFLPAKNITFTLMANAARVAAEEFQ